MNETLRFVVPYAFQVYDGMKLARRCFKVASSQEPITKEVFWSILKEAARFAVDLAQLAQI